MDIFANLPTFMLMMLVMAFCLFFIMGIALVAMQSDKKGGSGKEGAKKK